MKKIAFFAAMALTLVSFAVSVEEKIDPVKLTVPRAYTNDAGKVLLYRWAEPEKCEAGKKYPLVILFHGAGERGDNNTSQLVHGAKDLLNYAKAINQPIFFIAGQCPNNLQWVDTPWGNLEHRMPKNPSVSMGLAMELIEKVRKDPRVDLNRVYVTGISMGGYGTWDIVQRHPEWFAAAMPVCGGADVTLAWKVREVPIWCFHGGADNVVPTWRSRSMVSALWQCGGDIRYREYPGVGHGSWFATYADWDIVLKWFFSNVRK